MGERPILTTGTVHEYFKGLLTEARANQGVQVADVTEYYLVNLLAGFLETDRLYVREADGGLRDEPLALILQKALEGEGRERMAALRRLGDTSLYVSGFFSDHVDTKVVDAGYYAAMGHHAYATLARLLDGKGTLGGLYDELASKFTDLVDVLNEMSERVALSSSQGLVRLYERFLRTKSNRIARMLAAQGMVPALAAVKGVQ
jgi:hypothetical protein